jgi:hypothetical protein
MLLLLGRLLRPLLLPLQRLEPAAALATLALLPLPLQRQRSERQMMLELVDSALEMLLHLARPPLVVHQHLRSMPPTHRQLALDKVEVLEEDNHSRSQELIRLVVALATLGRMEALLLLLLLVAFRWVRQIDPR